MIIMKIIMSLLGIFAMLEASKSKQRITVTISDLKALEEDLLLNGVSSRAAEIIYSAASCNLHGSSDQNQRLDYLHKTNTEMLTMMHDVMNQLNELKTRDEVPEGTLELTVQHRLVKSTENVSNGVLLSGPDSMVVEPVVKNGHRTEYLALESMDVVMVDPETCKTFKVVKDILNHSRLRRHGIVKKAHEIYGYRGPHTITGLSKFYAAYTESNYDERIKVMGLAKLLGDFASLASESYFLEEAYDKHASSCGDSLNEGVRKKRNVMQSMIQKGVCINKQGKNNSELSGIDFLLGVPFAVSIDLEEVHKIGSCLDPQSAWRGVIERNTFRVAISASYNNETNACVKVLICKKGFVIGESGCVKGTDHGSFSNVKGLEISVIKNRVSIDEVPEELKKFSRRYCSIQGKNIETGIDCAKPIRSKEKFTLIKTGGSWFVTDRDVLIAHGQDSRDICFYSCSSDCPNSCLECSGDEAYESAFGKWDSKGCSCSYCHNCSDIYVQIEAAKIGADAVAHVEWDVTLPIESEELVICTGCKVSCNGRKLKIERDSSFDVIHMCVDEQCELIDSQETDFNFNIPSKLLHATSFRIMFFRSDGKGRATVEVACLDSHTCDAIHCDVCHIRFANPHCYKLINWVILVTILASAVLIAPLLCCLMTITRCLVSIALSPLRFAGKLLLVLFKKCTRKSFNVANRAGERINRIVNEETELTFRPRNTSSGRSLEGLLVLILIILPFVGVAMSCENTLNIDSKTLECQPSMTGDMKCSLTTVISAPLSSVGEETCINLRDQMGALVQIIKLRTTLIKQKCSKTVEYYTCDGDFKLLNTFRCRNAGDCVDDKCEKVGPNDKIPVESVNDERAGVSGCQRVTGFWGKGCFYASQACQFYKVELQNKIRTSYEVFRCSEWFWEVSVNVTISSKDGVRNDSIVLDTSVPIKTIIGLAQLVTINAPVITDVSKCFIRKLSDGMKTAITDCSRRNNPIIGLIGGIQCATPNLAEMAGRACVIDKNSVQLLTQDDNVVFINRFANVSKLWSENLLPSNLSNAVINEDKEGQVSVHYLGSSSYILRVRMNNYKVSYSITKPKCEVHFRNLAGCSNCGSGAVLQLEVVLDTATRAPVIVTCPSSITQSSGLVLSTNPVTDFKMAFMKPNVDEDCNVTCPGNVAVISITGHLLNNIVISGSNQTTLFSKGSDFFASVPWLHLGFLRYIYLIIGIIIVIPIILLIILLIYRTAFFVTRLLRKRSRYDKFK